MRPPSITTRRDRHECSDSTLRPRFAAGVPGSSISVVLIGQAALVTGANVVVNYVIEPEAVVESIRKHGSRALSIRADLSQEKAYVVKS